MKAYYRIFALLLAVVTVLAVLISCGKTDDTEVWDYERDSSLTDFAVQVKLNETNLESDFDKTGRGLVTVETFIDGDTVHFLNYSKTAKIKVRFLGIDTPESTGKVEPWGKVASIYTKSCLSNATAIVIESDEDGNPVFDSTGDRYLAWVWYKTKDSDTWRNLNIDILQNGLAMGKSTSSNRYGDVALAALTDARANKLNMYSGKQAPFFYYGDTVELTIKALVADKSTYNGMKVRFEGVVTKAEAQAVYVEAYDEDTNQSYGVYVYGGYASLAPRFLVPGYRLQITGTVDNNETYGFQISGLSFSIIDPTKDDVQILEKDIEVKPTPITADELNTNESLEATFVSLTGLTVVDVYTTTDETSSSNGAMTLTCKTADGKMVKVRTVVLTLDGKTVTEDYFRGVTMNVSGMVDYYNGEAQLKLLTLGDCVVTAQN